MLGVIKTMASIDQPPAVLGKMIGGALVGTFLGVLLAYGLMGPLAARLK
ncbi:MAG: flagellar motor stator protein MotA, partial [Rubritepida sp.]|nr:flagellar motor stator protein MotA [Rubritepida sp.]